MTVTRVVLAADQPMVLPGLRSPLAPSVTRRLVDTHVSRPQPAVRTEHRGLAELTPCEREVLSLVATGQINAEIAAALR